MKTVIKLIFIIVATFFNLKFSYARDWITEMRKYHPPRFTIDMKTILDLDKSAAQNQIFKNYLNYVNITGENFNSNLGVDYNPVNSKWQTSKIEEMIKSTNSFDQASIQDLEIKINLEVDNTFDFIKYNNDFGLKLHRLYDQSLEIDRLKKITGDLAVKINTLERDRPDSKKELIINEMKKSYDQKLLYAFCLSSLISIIVSYFVISFSKNKETMLAKK